MSKASNTRFAKRFMVAPGERCRLDKVDPDSRCGLKDKDAVRDNLPALQGKLDELQELLYAQAKHAVLVVIQARDTGGKDSTIRHVFGPLNPQGVRVTSFKAPSDIEKAHDYLWRIHQAVPAKGMIGVFNRSHYEDILVPKVKQWVPPRVIKQRYQQINSFERYLTENNVTILKLYLHISKDEQAERLQARLDRPDKHWKFNSADLQERALWDDYTKAFEAMLHECSTPWAPWYVIPANRKWARNWVVTKLFAGLLSSLDLAYPPAEEGLESIVIK